MFTTAIIHALLWLLTLYSPAPLQGSRAAAQRGPTRNPHGPIAIPCENCHTFTSWKPVRSIPEFDHNRTRYPLRGLHEKVACRQCHVKLVFTDLSTRCADCHADIHRGQFGANCEKCHSVAGWQTSLRSIRDHFNRFPLLGAHAVLQCEDCHKNGALGQFTGLSTDCVACHMADFQRAKSPDHNALGFPTACQSCHSMDAWQGAKFDHGAITGFMLTGAHARLNCLDCHVGGRFQGTPANCYACHAKDYQATTNPNHVQAGFPQDCSRCHTTASWLGAKFDHNTFTSFPLTGAHLTVPCAQCHVNGRFAGTPRACASCHLADYQKTTDPNHVAAGFPTDCSICHSTSSWAGAKFDHSQTGFPLTGAHVNVACATCHVNGQYAGLSAACSSCHINDYNGAKNPDHKAGGFPLDCTICHNTTGWIPASFDHSKTAFPLTGAHVSVPCTSCHIGGQYAGTPTDCYSCHKTEYNTVTNPNHVAAGFPTTCATCHNTSSWTGATFNHTWFPIYSGTHAGKWTTCNDCHTNPSNFAVFSCITCHAHDQATMDQKHQGVRNYVYNSANCYSCHPQGVAN